MKKYILGLIILTVISTPVTARALTMSDMQAQIQSLLAIVMQLQQQLLTLMSEQQIDSSYNPDPSIETPTYNKSKYYLQSSTTEGPASLTVRFTTNVISEYTSDEQIFIDFGDGSKQELKMDCSIGGFWGCDNQTLILEHTYYNPGVYNVSIISGSNYFTDLREVIEVTGDSYMPRTIVSSLDILDNNYHNGVHVYDISSPNNDVIHINWKLRNTSIDTSNMGMYIMLKGVDGTIIKTQRVNVNSGYAKIDLTGVCNGFFSDGLDGDCAMLKNRIKQGKTKYSLEAVIYTSKNACLGFCSPEYPVVHPTVVSRAFSDPFNIISSTTSLPQPTSEKTIKKVEFLLSDQLNRETFGRDITARVWFSDGTVATSTLDNKPGCAVTNTLRDPLRDRLNLAVVSCYAATHKVKYVAWIDNNDIFRVDRLDESTHGGGIIRTTLWQLPVKGLIM